MKKTLSLTMLLLVLLTLGLFVSCNADAIESLFDNKIKESSARIVPQEVSVEGGEIVIGEGKSKVKVKLLVGGTEQTLTNEQVVAVAEKINNLQKNETITSFKNTNLENAVKLEKTEVLNEVLGNLKKGTSDPTAKANIEGKSSSDISLSLNIKLSKIDVESSSDLTITSMEFDVTPIATITVKNSASEDEIVTAEIKTLLEEPVKFRLPVDSSITDTIMAIYHEGAFLGNFEIKTEGNEKYVEIESQNFSKYGYQIVNEDNAGANIGNALYFKFEDAIAAVKDNDIITLRKPAPADPTKDIVIDKAITFKVDTDGQTYTDKIKAADGYNLSAEPNGNEITYSVSVLVVHTVTFDLNGITGTAPTAQTITSGEKVTKPADPTDTVHTFAGWYKTKDVTTGALSDEWDFDNDTVTADMTLYAKWTKTTVSVTGVSLNLTELTLEVDGSHNLTATVTPENATNKAVSWSSSNESVATVSNGTVTAIAAGTANITVTTEDGGKTAICTVEVSPTTYTVTFDLNGITGTAPTAQTITSGEKVTKPADPTDTVHTFAGWYKTKDATTGALSDPWDFDTDTVTANTTLYAQWTRTLESIYTNSDIPKVTGNSAPDDAWVNDDGGKAFIANSTGNATLTLTKQLQPSGAATMSCRKTELFTKIGDDYVFSYGTQYGVFTLHMEDDKVSSIKYEYDGADSNYPKLIGTYAAPAAAATYSVTYNANGATSGTAPADQTKNKDEDLTLATNTGNLVKSGYRFTGWNTASDGKGIHYDAGASYTSNADLTLYAEWVKTVADVLPEGFPTSKDTGWKNENEYSMFINGDNLVIYTSDGDPVDTLPLGTKLTKYPGIDSWNAISSRGPFDFNMSESNLISIVYFDYLEYGDAIGTYTQK